MSARRPLNEGARSVPLLVHSRNSTCATSRGSTNTVPLGGWRPLNGLLSVRKGSSSRFTSASDCSVKPVPTFPQYTSSPAPCPAEAGDRGSSITPTASEPRLVLRPPSPGVQPPITTSWVCTFFTLIQCEARAPGVYGQSSFFATTPSMPSSFVAASRALPSPRW